MYTFHTDAGHGWLEVPMSELRALGIERQISQYSYISRDGERAYLEEDCDLSIFCRAKGLSPGEDKSIEDRNHAGDAFIRFLPRFPARAHSHSAAVFSMGAL